MSSCPPTFPMTQVLKISADLSLQTVAMVNNKDPALLGSGAAGG